MIHLAFKHEGDNSKLFISNGQRGIDESLKEKLWNNFYNKDTEKKVDDMNELLRIERECVKKRTEILKDLKERFNIIKKPTEEEFPEYFLD
jgi:hypothetical protein